MIPLSTPVITALRVFLVLGIIYLGGIGTLKLVWMRRVCKILDEHTKTIAKHSQTLAAVLTILSGPDPASPKSKVFEFPARARLAAIAERAKRELEE